MGEGSGESFDEALDICPLSVELPLDHKAAWKKKREYTEYLRERYTRRSRARKDRVESNAEHEDQESTVAGKIREFLSKYTALLMRLEQEENAEGRVSSAQTKPDLHQKALNMLKQYWVSIPKNFYGHVPGIDVGYQFHSRLMLSMVGMHRPLQAGIGYTSEKETNQGVSLVTSIALTGGYEDNIDNGDVIIYTGHGGNDYEGSKKQIKDQELNKGNIALTNNFRYKKPVRVIRKCIMSNDRERHGFRYDGLYIVEKWWKEKGRSGFLVYKFRLRREEGQPLLLSNAVQFIRDPQGKNRVAIIKQDIAEGREKFPITVVNSVDDVHIIEGFRYVRTVKYPDWLSKPAPPKGCGCLEGCRDDKECFCAALNGGKFPYTENGRLIKSQQVIYECGPSCRCSPNCRNRVSQRGLKYKLEVFRTPRNGWGVRSDEFLEAGDFITEYAGNLTADPTASSSHMMFPIAPISMKGNLGDLHGIFKDKDEDAMALPSQVVENVGFCVDASTSGNASRFIRRSSRSNLCAQYVLYDHHDIRIPHVMFFAMVNIAPRLELSINASVQQNKQICTIARYTGKASSLGQRTKFG